MSSVKGVRAGRAFVELFADDSKLVRSDNRVTLPAGWWCLPDPKEDEE